MSWRRGRRAAVSWSMKGRVVRSFMAVLVVVWGDVE
jgi:hypothetical protein